MTGGFSLERATRFELATLTLARLFRIHAHQMTQGSRMRYCRSDGRLATSRLGNHGLALSALQERNRSGKLVDSDAGLYAAESRLVLELLGYTARWATDLPTVSSSQPASSPTAARTESPSSHSHSSVHNP